MCAGPPVALNDVLHPGETVPRVDAAMEEALAEHLPAGGTIPESARESITTPQVAQVRAVNTRGLGSAWRAHT